MAAGSEDTDAVNVAQLKDLNTKFTNKLDDNKIHYFSVNSEDRKAPEDTNWNNDGATGENSIAIGQNAKAFGMEGQAMGSDAWSIGNYSQAWGNYAIAGVEPGIDEATYKALPVEEKKDYTRQDLSIGSQDNTLYYRTTFKEYTMSEFMALPEEERNDLKNNKGYGFSSTKNMWTPTPRSIAIGHLTKALGAATLAIGNITEATGNQSTAIGSMAKASGTSSFATDDRAEAQHVGSIAIGMKAKAGDYWGTAVGSYTIVEGEQSIALGVSTKAYTERGVALGAASKAEREKGVIGYALGGDNSTLKKALESSGENVRYNKALETIASLKAEYDKLIIAYSNTDVGSAAEAEARQALDAWNAKHPEYLAAVKERDQMRNAWQSGFGAVSVGKEDATRQITNVAAGSEDSDAVNVAQLKALNNKLNNKISEEKVHYFSVNADDSESPDGTNWNNDGAKGKNAIAIGRNASTIGPGTIAIGDSAKISNVNTQYALVIGENAESAHGSIVIGRNAKDYDTDPKDAGSGIFIGGDAKSFGGVAQVVLGTYGKVKGQGSTAIGNSTQALAFQSLAVGESSKVLGEGSSAFGAESIAEDRRSTALGAYTNARGQKSLAIGRSNVAAGHNSVAIDYQSFAHNGYIDGDAYNALSPEEQEKYFEASGLNAYFLKDTSDGSDWRKIGQTYLNTAVGSYSRANKQGATFGGMTSAQERGTAIGTYASAKEQGAVALGYNSKGSIENGVAIGAYSVAGREKGKIGYALGGDNSSFEAVLISTGQKARYDELTTMLEPLIAEYNGLIDAYYDATTSSERAEAGSKIDAWVADHSDFFSAVNEKKQIIGAWQSGNGTVSVGSAGSTRQIINVAAGSEDTDAVNVAQLKIVESIAKAHTELTLDGKSAKAGADGALGDYIGDNNLTMAVKDVNGQKVYDLKLSNEVVIDTPGKDGKDGMTRIVYVDEKDKEHTVATLEDGLKFAGDTENVTIPKKLNETLEVKGGISDAKLLTDKNIGVVAADGGLTVKLAKNLNLADGSITIASDSMKDENDKWLVKGQDGKWYSDLRGATYDADTQTYTKDGEALNAVTNLVRGSVTLSPTGLDNGNQRIVNVAPGKFDTDAVNMAQLRQIANKPEHHNRVTVYGETAKPGENGEHGEYVKNHNLTMSVKEVDGQLIHDIQLSKFVDLEEGQLTFTPPQDENNPTFRQAADANSSQVTLSAAGLDSGNQRIINVADGVDDKDAVNVSQLKANKVTLTAGDNVQITPKTETDGSTNYTIASTDTITGLTNITWDPTTGIVSGRAATEDQLNAAISNVVTSVGGAHTELTLDGKSATAGENGELGDYIGENNLTMAVKDVNGQKVNVTGGIYIANQKAVPTTKAGKTEDGLFITGLANTNWDPEANGIVENRAATEKQLKAVADSSAKVDATNLSDANVNSWKTKLGITDTLLGEAGAWKLTVNVTGERSVKKDSVINFVNGSKIQISQSGNDITVALDPAFVKEVNDNTTNISNLTTRVTKVEGDVTNVKQDITKINNDITNINKDITNINTKIENIEGKAGVANVVGDIETGVKVEKVDANDATKGVKVSLDEKITVGGITIDGKKSGEGETASRTITGLTNTKWDADNVVEDRAATEGQLKDFASTIAGSVGATTINGDDNINAVKVEGKNEYNLSLSDDLKVGNSISVDNMTYISKDGINANDKEIKNVKAVELSADGSSAATTGQVYMVREELSTAIGGVATAVQNNAHQISKLDSKVNKSDAGAAALAALHPLDYDPDNKWNFTAGMGTYHGSNAVALGAFYRPNENTLFSIGGSMGNGENMMNMGVSLKFGNSNLYAGMSKGRLIEYVEKQTSEIDDLKAQNESQNERIQKLEELVQSLMSAR